MATSLSITLEQVIRWTYASPLDLSTPKDTGALDLGDTLANGTGDNLADMIFHDQRTLTATSEELDLAGSLPNTLTGTAMTFAKVKGLIIKVVTTGTGKKLTIGGAAANAWLGWFADASDKEDVDPNGIYMQWSPTDGKAVTAGTADKLKIDAGANTIVYDIIIIGTSA